NTKTLLMSKIFSSFLLLLLFVATQAQLKYPVTKKVDQIDDYHGTKVSDPYRWLENDNSDETKAWVKSENDVTNAYFAQIHFKDGFKKRI
ncbi:hypothetical protein ABTM00_19940, partial [Acinetobacter baumannii]